MIEVDKQELGNSAKIIELKPRKVFDYNSLMELLPIVVRITKQYSEKVTKLIQKLEHIAGQEKMVQETELEINDLIQEWQVKVEKLGAVTKGLWIADFDSGDGYFCWKYPEEQILYWHGYRDGFSGRRPVKDYLDKKISEHKLSEKKVSEDIRQDSLNENRNRPNQHPHSEL